jgi:hypothetical protein
MLGIFFQGGFSFSKLYNHQLHFASLCATIKASHYKQQRACHKWPSIYILKVFKGKTRVMETQIFHHAKT